MFVATVHFNTESSLMELPVAKAAYKPRLPLSIANGTAPSGGLDESSRYQCYGDGSNVASHRSDALSGYETVDSPPHYDFYANTEVWGRRRRFRPSLYQLSAKPEVGKCAFSQLVWFYAFKMTEQTQIVWLFYSYVHFGL